MSIQKLKEMFAEMVVKKNASLIKQYYHRDFLLYTNGQYTDFNDFLKSHEGYYSSMKQYQIRYDDKTFIQSENKVAGRLWISISEPNYPVKDIEVMLIAEYKDEQIYRL